MVAITIEIAMVIITIISIQKNIVARAIIDKIVKTNLNFIIIKVIINMDSIGTFIAINKD